MTEEVLEQPKPTEEQEDALLAEGYKRAGGDTPAPKEPVVEKPDLQIDAKASAEIVKEALPKEPEPDPWKDVPPVVRQHLENISATLPKFDQRLKSAEGVVGTIRAGQDAAKAAAKAGYEAPALEQIQAAGASTKKWDELKENFPDWAEGLEERDAAREAALVAKVKAEFEAQRKRGFGDQAPLFEKSRAETINEVKDILDRRDVQAVHPDWEEVINTEEFQKWGWDGGPSDPERKQFKAIEASIKAGQTDPLERDKALHFFATKYPQWWGERGATIYTGGVSQTINTLALFKTSQKSVEQNQRKKERLAAAVPVQGQGSGGPTVPSEDELLAIGYKRAGGGK